MALRRIIFSLALSLFSAVGYAAGPDENWLHNLEQWRAQRAQQLQSADGWLTVVGLDWLQPGVNTVGAAADNSARIEGLDADHLFVLRNDDGRILLEPAAQGFPAGLSVNGAPAAARELTLHGKPELIRYGSFSFFVIARGDGYALRVRNSESETRLHFHGLNWYRADAGYRVTAQWVPYTTPRKVEIESVVNTTSEAQLLGEVRFTLHGKPVVLTPVFYGDDAHELFFVLRDATSSTTTYPASRFLSAPLPDHGLKEAGAVELDFNRLENPPCAFTAFATCPLPLAENRLKIAIEAGEKRYHE